MPVIKFLHYDDSYAYGRPQDIKQLLRYIAKLEATEYPPHSCQHLVGAMPDIILSNQPGAWKRAASLFYHQLELYPNRRQLLQHRVISFGEEELSNPVMAFELAKVVASFYFECGYISFFGVHLDTDNLHIHIAVSTVNWRNGSCFFICNELGRLQSGITMWYQNYMQGKILPLFYASSIEQIEQFTKED